MAAATAAVGAGGAAAAAGGKAVRWGAVVPDEAFAPRRMIPILARTPLLPLGRGRDWKNAVEVTDVEWFSTVQHTVPWQSCHTHSLNFGTL